MTAAYDAANQQVRVNTATLTYDATGNLISITRSNIADLQLRIIQITPDFARAPSSIQVTLTGTTLLASKLSTDNPGITATVLRATDTSIVARLDVAVSARLGQTILTVDNGLATAATTMTIHPAAPPPFVTPDQITLKSGGGGHGRIRFEAFRLAFLSNTVPPYSSSVPGPVFIPGPPPTLKIASVNSIAVPAVPGGSYSASDITLPATTTNPITVVLSASNIPVGTAVEVSSIPQFGPKSTTTVTLSGTTASSTATANINIATDKVNVLSAQVTFIQTASLSLPEINGEKVELAQLTSTMGQGSTLTYITSSAKEYNADQLGIWPLIRVDSRGQGGLD